MRLHTHSTRRRFRASLFALAALLAVLTVATWLIANHRDPRAISQDELHRIATHSESAVMKPLPRLHRVVIEPVSPGEVLDATVAYLPQPGNEGTQFEVQGLYDPLSEEIHITGVLVRIQASFAKPWIQPLFRQTLRHEYGHAFLYDWTKDHGWIGTALGEFGRTQGSIDPSEFPSALRGVVIEYQRVDSEVYGSSYFTSSFNEYVAESYARYLDGEDVPPHVRRLLDSASDR
ncbi:MAG TPA: hypothetical protein VLA05_04400 [Coriobacteriia bacterium]|nr:hypothetical protein [Coriobacteriia bacterium]